MNRDGRSGRDTTSVGPVLVVDDEPYVRGTFAEYLRACGLSVTEASNGLEALACFTHRSPAAVVLDLLMPKLGGLRTLRHIRMLDPTVPVVAVTGSTDPDLHRRATAEGASCLLMKPIKLDDLRAALGDVAGSDGEGLAAAPGLIEPPRTAGQVLVIDDEPGVRQLLTELLTKDVSFR